MSAKSIKEYAKLCVLFDRQPDQVEFLAMAMFGIMPTWLEDKLNEESK